jgi:AhpD family alkylhydroperoxidase
MKAFSGIAQTALAPKALDGKAKELIALGIGIAIRCDDCIAFHIKAAVERGATREAKAAVPFVTNTTQQTNKLKSPIWNSGGDHVIAPPNGRPPGLERKSRS